MQTFFKCVIDRFVRFARQTSRAHEGVGFVCACTCKTDPSLMSNSGKLSIMKIFKEMKLPGIPAIPHQRDGCAFVKRLSGSSIRCFRASWFKELRDWIPPEEIKGVSAEPAFVSSLNLWLPSTISWLGDRTILFFAGPDGLIFKWKNATVSFKKHRDSKCHREAVEVMLTR